MCAGTGVREQPDMGAELRFSGPAASHFSSLIITFLKLINLFNVHWCFVYMHVCVRALGSLELDLQTVVSCHEGAGIEPRSTERAARALSHPFSPTPIITFNRLFYQEPCLLCSEKFRLASKVEQRILLWTKTRLVWPRWRAVTVAVFSSRRATFLCLFVHLLSCNSNV